MNINVDCDISGVKSVLKANKGEIRKKAKGITKDIAADIIKETRAEYAAAANEIATIDEAHSENWTTKEDVTFKLSTEGTKNSTTVIGEDGASWLEFGTGVRKNISEPHPQNPYPYGSFGKGLGASGHSWAYGKGLRSYGYKATCAMYDAAERARRNIKKYISGVF